MLAFSLKLIQRCLAALGLLLVLITCTPAVIWYAGLLAGPWTDARGHVLIVLGGGAIDDGIIGESSYWRSVYAVLAWRQGGFQEILLSGEAPIVDPMKRFLISEGVPESAIRLESRSRTTRENALFTRSLLASGTPRKLVLLTSDYHMHRAWRAFRAAGLDTVPRPFPDARKRGQNWQWRWSVFLELVAESGKIVYYYARGWL